MTPIEKSGCVGIDNGGAGPDSSYMDPVYAFLSRCDQAQFALGLKRSTLSTKLFNDGKRLDGLASGRSDIGARRLARAERDLSVMEGEARKSRSAV